MDQENHSDRGDEERAMENEDPGDVESSLSEISEKSMRASYQEPLLVKGTKSNRSNTTSQIAIVGANTCPIESLDYE